MLEGSKNLLIHSSHLVLVTYLCSLYMIFGIVYVNFFFNNYNFFFICDHYTTSYLTRV